MANRTLFQRNTDIITTLKKGEAYFAGISDSTQDILVMPQSEKLTKKIAELSSALQNGNTQQERANLATQCLKEIDTFRGILYQFQKRTGNNLYAQQRKPIDEFHSEIVMYKVLHLN